MFCQECGRQMRDSARFCNKCGTPVRQRFGGFWPPPETETAAPQGSQPPQVSDKPPPKNSWPRVEDTLVMPMVGKPAAEPESADQEPAPRAPRKDRNERATLFEPPPPKAPKAPAPEAPDENPPTASRRPPTSALQRDAARKPFFTQVAPALSNRQHSRLVLIVPVLVLIFIGVLVLAYIAAK
jgi:hypothetical protein